MRLWRFRFLWRRPVISSDPHNDVERAGATKTNVYPGSTRFNWGSAAEAPGPNGEPGGHVSWKAYYSVDEPAQVVDHYMAAFGLENHHDEANGHAWHISLNTGADRVIDV